jgi:lysophospholipase L1-like esterase
VLTGGTVGMTGTKTRLAPGAVFRVGFCNGCDAPQPATVQLSWFYTPDMGTADVVVDGAVVASLQADGRRVESDVQFMNMELADERSVIEVRNRADAKPDKNAKPNPAITSKAGPVHLLSVSSETGGRGVVLDAMGLPGTTGMTPQRWRQDLLTEEVKARGYDLVITAWGTNEAGISRLDEQTYRHHFGNTLKTLVSSSGADCLIMGASDRLDFVGDNWQAASNHAMVERVQRSLAAEHGCAFFSLRTAMGGPGSMKQWVANKQALPDHVHFTRDGYRVLADRIIDDLLQDYGDWKLSTLDAAVSAEEHHVVP